MNKFEEYRSRDAQVESWLAERIKAGLNTITACEMAVGQKGRVVDPTSEHFGKILIRVNNGAVRFDGERFHGVETWSYAGGPEPHYNGPYVEVIVEG